MSASELRRIVGITAQKTYLSDGGQQDAEEFLRTLFEQLMVELPAGHTFLPILQSFWGKKKVYVSSLTHQMENVPDVWLILGFQTRLS